MSHVDMLENYSYSLGLYGKKAYKITNIRNGTHEHTMNDASFPQIIKKSLRVELLLKSIKQIITLNYILNNRSNIN